MMTATLVESTGAQSMRTASRSTKYEWQRRATRSTAGVETLETPLATRTSTSQCKRRSRTTHQTQQDVSPEIRSSDWPGKKPIRPQTQRKNGAPGRGQPLPSRRRTSSLPAIQRRFPAIRAGPRRRVATRSRTRRKRPKHQRPDRQGRLRETPRNSSCDCDGAYSENQKIRKQGNNRGRNGPVDGNL